MTLAIKDGASASTALKSTVVSSEHVVHHISTTADGTTAVDPATSTLQTAAATLTGAVNETAPASDTASSGLNGRLQRIAQRLTSLIALLPSSLGIKAATGSLSVVPASDAVYPTRANDPIITSTVDITRPADTNAYTIGDALSDSTSAPTVGGFTAAAARASGKTVLLTDMVVTSSNSAGGLSGEVWFFDTAVTAVNDNAAFAISDAESKTLVAKVPFSLIAGTNNAHDHVRNLGIGITTVGSVNLRYLVKVLNAYTPASGEVITIRPKFLAVD